MSKMKALIPNLLTAGNLVGGVMAIIFSLTGKLEWAPYCIFISAFLDFFDGFAARLLKVQSEMGKQLDSLADMVTFGVAPGVMVFVLLDIQNFVQRKSFLLNHLGGYIDHAIINPNNHSFANSISGAEILGNPSLQSEIWMPLIPFIAFLIPVFAMFMLAKFNLDTRQSDSFIGVPTPAMTLFFASLPLIIFTTNWDWNYLYDLLTNPWFLVISTVVFSVLMVSELPLFALKFKSFGFKGNEIRYIFLTLAVILLATLWWLAIPLVIILYILLSLIQNLRHKTAAAKTSK